MDKTYPYFMPFVQNITFHYTRFFILKKYIQFMKTKEKTMKNITLTAIAFTMLFGAQLLVPNKSEAQIRCSTDFYGNTRCVDSYTGNSSNTRTDFYGNDNTTFSDGSSMSCRTDFYGNYVCN